jgi:glutamyl-Q tRNA(Asp) synthetase
MTVTRFAPSPTGYLHLGHAYAALFAAAAGRMRLRIEDIDATRCRGQFAAAILEDLDWLGVPVSGKVVHQSARMAAYRAALDSLSARGLVYPCFCTRKDIAAAASAPHGPGGPVYPGTCRHLSAKERVQRMAAEPYALRLDATAAAREVGPLTFAERGWGPNGETGQIAVDPARFGDVVLARKETPAAYHLAAVIDDAFQGVDLVTRGNDLFAATHVQRLLQALLGLPAPAYCHHKLILDTQGRKFSKRDHAVTLAALRGGAVTAQAIRTRLGF